MFHFSPRQLDTRLDFIQHTPSGLSGGTAQRGEEMSQHAEVVAHGHHTTGHDQTRATNKRLPLPIVVWAMVVAAFAMGADEFIVAGVVTEIATALSVSLGAVGQLESAYALGVAIGAPLFTAVGTRFPRRATLLAAASIFVGGNVISALGPTYEVILAGRLISAMAHGAFFGIAAVVMADMVDASRRGSAVATIFAGMTAATVLGAPLGAAVGQALGWRFTFWTLVILGGIALAGLIAFLPRRSAAKNGETDNHPAPAHHGEHALSTNAGHSEDGSEFDGLDAHARAHLGGGGQAAPLRAQLAALRRPAVWLTLLVTMLGYGGVFTSYVYIAPQLTEAAGFAESWLTPLLLLFGAGLFVGNYAGGKLADRWPNASVLATLSVLAIALFAMTLAITTPVSAAVGLFLFGAAAFSVVAPLQLRVMNKAGDAPDVASAANISAFTLGSAIGISLGGAAIDAGIGVTSVNWIGGLMTTSGLLLALISRRLDRPSSHVAPPAHVAHH
jgi:predicted MFS family arabinose efflux permease